MSADVKRFPKAKGAPRVRPICFQCGEAIAKRQPANQHDEMYHELARNALLKLRVFAEDSDPDGNGPVHVHLSSEGITAGWVGYGYPVYNFTWRDLFMALANLSPHPKQEAAELPFNRKEDQC